MNFSPDQMARAQEMMKNMSPDQLQGMFNTVQQNPQMMQQAMNMMNQGRGGPFTPPPTYQNAQKPAQPAKPSKYDFINRMHDMKASGNDKYKKQQFQQASVDYLQAILDITQFRKSDSSFMVNDEFIKELADIEIKIRNNYCACKSNLNEVEFLKDQSKEVLLLDESNFKGNYYLALYEFSVKNTERALELVNKALQNGTSATAVKLKDEIEREMEDVRRREQEDKAEREEKERMQEILRKREAEAKIEEAKNQEEQTRKDEQKQTETQTTNEEPIKQHKQPIPTAEPQQKQQTQPEAQEEETNPEKDDSDLEIKEEKDYSKYLNQTQHTAPPTNPTPKPAPKEDINQIYQQKAQEPKSEPKKSFLDRYMQLLIGILIGLAISYLFGK